MSSMISCTRKLEFDAAHRVMLHESKCKYMHGHRYVVEVTFAAMNGLDELGRVVDFGVIKQVLGGWIDQYWDHTAILSEADQALGDMIAQRTGQTIFYLPNHPTAENMADYLLTQVCPILFKDYPLECVAVRVHETPNCFADAMRSE